MTLEAFWLYSKICNSVETVELLYELLTNKQTTCYQIKLSISTDINYIILTLFDIWTAARLDNKCNMWNISDKNITIWSSARVCNNHHPIFSFCWFSNLNRLCVNPAGFGSVLQQFVCRQHCVHWWTSTSEGSPPDWKSASSSSS